MADNRVVHGMTFPGWLTVLFVALRLTGYISWSWVWVLSPLWITWALVALLFLMLAFVAYYVAEVL